VSSLSGGARVMGLLFPSTYFQRISIGTFTKSLEFQDLILSFISLAVIVLVYLLLSLSLLRIQER